MSDRINVQITATDGASRVFQQVSSGADKMGTSLDNAEKSAGRFGSTARLAGQAIGTALTAGLMLSVKAAADAEVSQQRLQTTIEATGALFEQYGAQIDAVNNKALSLSFDDEDAQDALSALIQATGDVQMSMDQMGLAMDIARGRGIDLAAATKLVIAADQERFGALQRVGIAIDENSTKESVLADLQAKYAGQAQAYADTNAGAFDRWQNSIENALENVGAFLGPAQQLLVVFPGIAAGAAAAGPVIGALGKQISAATKAAQSGTALASLASTLTGPAGIVAAAGVAVVGIAALASYLTDEYQSAAAMSVEATDEFTQALIALGQQGQLTLLQQQIAQSGLRIGDYSDSLNEAADAQNTLKTRIESTTASLGAAPGYAIYSRGLEDLTKAEQDAIDTNHDMFISLEELEAASSNIGTTMANTGETAQEFAAGWAAAQEDVNAILSDTGPAALEAQQQLLYYFKNLEDGQQTSEGFAKSVARVRDEMDAQNAAAVASGGVMAENTVAAEKYAAVLKDVGLSYNDMSVEAARAAAAMTPGEIRLFEIKQEEIDKAKNLADLLKIVGQNYNVMSVEAARAAAAADQQQKHINNTLDIAADNYNVMSVEAAKAAAAQNAVNAQLKDFENRIPSVEAARAGAQMSPIDIKVFLDDQEAQDKAKKIAAATEDMTRAFNAATVAATGTTEALDAGFRTVVTNTNAIGQSAQGVQDWADELIGAAGTYATMDDLLARGVITQQDYNAAQAAYTPIAEANARIQDDILAIQTRQAPVIADLADQQADYLDSLAGMPAEQQAFALAMMDSATSAQALSLATSLLGENGDVFAPMVEQAANLNPYLATILEQMGLIEQMPDGTWKVTADTADAQSQIDQLIASNERLIESQWVVMFGGDATAAEAAYEDATGYAVDWDGNESFATIGADNSDALAKIDESQNRAAEWDRTTASADINAVDNASGPLLRALALAHAFANSGATATFTANYVTVGDPTSHFLGLGGVAGYATGGVVAKMAEWGPELLHFPNGGLAVAQTPGIYGVPSGTYVDTAPVTAGKMRGLGGPSVTVNINAPVFGVDDLEVKIADSISRAWVRGMRQHELSVGAY